MADKENAKEALKELVEQFSSASKNKDYLNGQNEEWIKWNFLEPLLEKVLGWKKSDIEKEKRILKGRADYMLKLGNEEVLVVEAKKAGVNLSEDEGRQAVSYAYHRKVKLAMVTNFREIKVYHALTNIKNIDHNLIKFESGGYFRFSFEQFLENIDKLMFLSRENFENKSVYKLVPSKVEKASKPIDESILHDLLQFRDWLSKDLKKTRMHLSKEQIDEVVQMLIDRLIFMRSVEDRGLESANFLLGLVDDVRLGRTDKTLWSSLKEQFKTFDKSYNSKLFAEGLLEEEGFFDEQTLIKVIRGLYFGTKEQQARYMFDEIPGDLLGNIYEQYLGTILQGTEKRVKLEEESGKRKKMGIYYTPSYIVDYIVRNTVGEYIKNKNIDEILEVKIVDPACGSGSFIVRAFQEVCNAIENRLKKGEKGKMATFQSFKERLSFGQKISILTQCIYGIDLDEKAVELAQLNLLLKLLEEETPESHKRLLPNLRENIKCGNSLIEDSKLAGDKAFRWEAQFREAFNAGGFDIVIGNPPYGADLNEKDRLYLEGKYGLGNTDTACLFMDFATKILKSGGINGFIVPKPFVYSSTWGKIRELLLDGLLEIVDCGKVWKEVKLEQVIYFYKKGTKLKSYRSCIRKEKNLEFVGEISKDTFKEFGFLLNGISEKELEIGRKIRSAGKSLNEFVINQRGAMLQGGVTVKNSDLKVLGGKQIGRYIIKEDIKGYISKKQVTDNKAYLKENSILVQNLVAHIENPKDHIEIISSLVDKSQKDSLIILDTINQLSNRGKISSEALISVINSKLISWYAYRFIFGKAIRTMHFDSPVTERIIISTPEKKQEQKMADLVIEVTPLQKRLYESKLSGNEKERLLQQINNIDFEIDQEVYKLYGLTKEEQKTIEESLK